MKSAWLALLSLGAAGCGAQEEAAAVCGSHDSWTSAEVAGHWMADSCDSGNCSGEFGVSDKNRTDATADGTLTSCRPDRYYRYTGFDNDPFPDRNNPHVTLDADGPDKGLIKLCVSVACQDGATNLSRCDDGENWVRPTTPTASSLDLPVCCRVGPGTIAPSYTCDDAISNSTSNDTATFLIHVCTTADSVGSNDIAYKLSMGF